LELSEKHLIALCVSLVALFAYSFVDTNINTEYSEDIDDWYIVEGMNLPDFQDFGYSGGIGGGFEEDEFYRIDVTLEDEFRSLSVKEKEDLMNKIGISVREGAIKKNLIEKDTPVFVTFESRYYLFHGSWKIDTFGNWSFE